MNEFIVIAAYNEEEKIDKVIKDLKKGKKFTRENISSIRGGKGLDPKYLKFFIGKKAIKKFKSSRPLSFKMKK